MAGAGGSNRQVSRAGATGAERQGLGKLKNRDCKISRALRRGVELQKKGDLMDRNGRFYREGVEDLMDMALRF